MSRRQVQLVLVCEDAQHEAFVRRFLEREGWEARQVRVEKAPPAAGAAHHWVRTRYPQEVRALRSRPDVARALIVMVDADTGTYEERLRGFADELDAAGDAGLAPNEPVAILVPKRNIETWIAYLQDWNVDEETMYPKLRRERECDQAVRQLKAMCDSGRLRDPVPPSLQRACTEYRARVLPRT